MTVSDSKEAGVQQMGCLGKPTLEAWELGEGQIRSLHA